MNKLPNTELEVRKMFSKAFPLNPGMIDDIILFEKDFSPTTDYGVIHHYTSLETFGLIISNRTFRFTNIKHLNDGQEYTYALNLLEELIQDKIQDLPSEERLHQSFANLLKRLADIPPIYVACFSRSNDRLSQWRGYTPHGPAVSINLESLSMPSSGLEYAPLFDVIYDPKRQRGIISDALVILEREYYRSSDSTEIDKHMKSAEYIIYRCIQPILSSMKNPLFYEEEEVRWMIDLNKSENIQHLKYLQPRSIDMKIASNKPLPILGITFGPQSDSTINIKIAQDLLSSVSTLGENIEVSNIPLRKT